MDGKDYTQANRVAWNEVAPIHRRTCGCDLRAEFTRPGYSTLDELVTGKLLQLGLQGKRVAQLCCNNGRELLSLVNLGACSGVGFDISDAFIAEADELRDIAGLDCSFVRTDALDIDSAAYEPFGLVYISIGALCWIPHLDEFFRIVAGLLESGGHLLIYEMHPVVNMLAFPGDENFVPEHPARMANPYFTKEVMCYTDGLDYYGGEQYEASPKYEFVHTLSDIMNAILRNGMQLLCLEEYPHDISNLLGFLGENNHLPLSYILTARKQ